MMARVKMPAGPALANWQEADAAVRQLGVLQLQREGIEARLTEEITQRKDEAKRRCDQIDLEIKNLGVALQGFVTAHRGEFAPAQGRVLEFGMVGFRKSTSIAIKDMAEALKRAKDRGLTWIISVKESVNKDAMANLNDCELYQLGAERKTVERFFVEPDRARVQETL